MVNLKKLTKTDFEKLLKNYNIGKYKSHKHIVWALGNTVYFLTTTKGKYVVKIFQKSKPDFINFQVKIMDFIENKGLPIAKITETKNKKNLLIYNKHRILIQKFIRGKEAKNPSNRLIKDIAKKQALLNKNLLKVKLTEKYTWGKDYQFKPMKERIDNVFGFNWEEEEKILLKEIRKLKKNKLRKSVIHGDFHKVNLIVKDDKLKSIIDWDDVHEDFLVFEIAVFITHTFLRKNSVRKDGIKLYLREYQKHLKLNDEEKKAIYYFVKHRLLSVLPWCMKQRQRHKDSKKMIGDWIVDFIKFYWSFDKISLKEFLSWF